MKYGYGVYLLLLLAVTCAAEVSFTEMSHLIILAAKSNMELRLIWMLSVVIPLCQLKSEQSLKVMTTRQPIFHPCRLANRYF